MSDRYIAALGDREGQFQVLDRLAWTEEVDLLMATCPGEEEARIIRDALNEFDDKMGGYQRPEPPDPSRLAFRHGDDEGTTYIDELLAKAATDKAREAMVSGNIPLDEWSKVSPEIYRDVILDELGRKAPISGLIPIAPEELSILQNAGMGEWANKYCLVVPNKDEGENT